MKRALVLMAAAGALLVQVGAASAQEKTQGPATIEPRGGPAGTTNPKGNAAGANRGAGGYVVSDSMARSSSVRPSSEPLSLGAGGGGMFDDKALPKDGFKQRDKVQTDLGGSVPLSKNLSLKAAGRYDHLGSISDKGLDGLGGNLGLKISF